jgi:inorganic pyrophosphatase
MVNISHNINEKNNTVYVTVTGRLTGEDMIKHATTIILEPAHRPGMDFITDISEAEIDPSFEMLVRFHNHLKAYEWKLRKYRSAFIVGDHNNRKAVELYRSLSALSNGHIVEIFKAREEAEKWINSK